MNPTLGGIYNPQEMPETEFLARYSVRLELTDRIFQSILASGPEEDPDHFVIQGQRGQGKTSLLRRIQLALRDHPETSGWLIPVLFKEELYGVTSLCRLWEEAGRLLHSHPSFSGLNDAFEAAWETPHYDKDCHLILDQALRQAGVRLVLLVDNLGDLLSKLGQREQQRLREILHTTRRIQIVGASTVMLEQHYDHGAPFYQFFREVNLPGLEREETLILLRNLGTPEQQERLEQVITRTPGRIETLRRLTAGVPRTLVLLFDILLAPDGNAFRDLELLLDRVTPLYKHRMDDLPAQQQAIVDAVALGWDAVSTKEIARATRLPSKQVSAQLKQLERANIIHREPTSTKNNLYRVQERFFNIWYLMRHGRPGDRQRALWLVRFLEAWCTPEDLRDRAERHLGMLADRCLAPDHARFMTEALRGAGVDLEMENRLVKATRDYMPEEVREEVEPSVMEIMEQVEGRFPVTLRPLLNPYQLAQVGIHTRRQFVEKVGPQIQWLSITVKNVVDKREQILELMEANNPEQAASLVEQTVKIIPPQELRNILGLHKIFQYFISDTAILGANAYHILGRFEDAKRLLRLASAWDKAKLLLAFLNFELGKNPEETITLLSGISRGPENIGSTYAYQLCLSLILVWNQRLPEAFEALNQSFVKPDFNKGANIFSDLLTLLLAADQTAYVRSLFEDELFAVHRLKDRFKPFYYALLADLGENRADELKRMGPELAQTVGEIHKRVEEWRVKYFGDPSKPEIEAKP